MKTFVTAAALVAGALAQNAFEPVDFNVTEALLDNGVDVSAIPELAQLQQRSLQNACSIACKSLKTIFGDDQVESKSESAYEAFVGAFWSAQQREISPECIFKPEKSLDVSTSVLISRLTGCPFAAKSGGHSAIPGGSNIEGGITIDFKKMNSIAISGDKKSVTFQPGHTWFNIYTALEKENLAVNGGRVSSVGVGGLLLGGGIAYTSGIYGMGCDNILSYELVTASGVIINVSESKYADLYWALRGGGNNFGIVTKFTLETFPQGPKMWGGQRTYTQSAFPAIIDAYYNLGMNAKSDPKAHQIVSFGWRQPSTPVANVELEYTEPTGNATILEEYNAIGNALRDITAVRSLSELTSLLDGAASGTGLRQLFSTWTMKLDKELALATKDVFYEELPSIVDAADLVPAASLQVMTVPLLEKMTKRGGNALGLSAKDGPLTNVAVALKWSDSADDERMKQFAKRLRDRVTAIAKQKGKSHPFVYMNYASAIQDPIASYGAANKDRLKSISKKYDPTSVFQKLQPGYFKLDGAPLSA